MNIQQMTVFENQGQMEIDRDSVRWYFRGVHADDCDNAGFIIWAEKLTNTNKNPWRQHGYKWTELLTHIRKISADSRKDTYLSVQTFCAPFRRMETLYRLNAIAFDIDAHTEINPQQTIENARWILERDIFSQAVLPMPSMIIGTGRGLQVVYLLEPLPRQGLPLWSLVGEAMAERIRTCFNEHVSVSVQLDGNYGDVTRVLRVPGTYNQAAQKYAQVLLPDVLDDNVLRYRLDGLRDEFLPELIKREKGKSEKRIGRKVRVTYLFNAFSLHMARLDDLMTLLEIRSSTAIAIDGRRRMVFLYRYWSCFCVGQDVALEAALAFNARFSEPLSERVVRQDTASAEKAYEAWKIDHKKGYNYRNDTLIRFLEIAEEEQRLLKTIIGADEKKRRQKDKNWYNDKRDKKRHKASNSRENEIVTLLNEGYSQNEIRSKTGASRNTISKYARAHGIVRTQGQRTDVYDV